jgi:hypothetical protein
MSSKTESYNKKTFGEEGLFYIIATLRLIVAK